MEHSEHRALKLILRRSGDPERTERLGPYGLESLIEADEEGAATVWRVSIAPRQRTSVSYHLLAEEYYFVLAGSGTAILDGNPYPLAPGDFLRLPPGTKHAFVTTHEALDLLNVQTPGCRPDRDVYFADGAVPEGFADLGGETSGSG